MSVLKMPQSSSLLRSETSKRPRGYLCGGTAHDLRYRQRVSCPCWIFDRKPPRRVWQTPSSVEDRLLRKPAKPAIATSDVSRLWRVRTAICRAYATIQTRIRALANSSAAIRNASRPTCRVRARLRKHRHGVQKLLDPAQPLPRRCIKRGVKSTRAPGGLLGGNRASGVLGGTYRDNFDGRRRR
jgi:hypothetical protein